MYISMYNYTKRHCERSGADHVITVSVFSSPYLSICVWNGKPFLCCSVSFILQSVSQPSLVESRFCLAVHNLFVKFVFPEIKCLLFFHLFSRRRRRTRNTHTYTHWSSSTIHHNKILFERRGEEIHRQIQK